MSTEQKYAHELVPHYDTDTPMTPHGRALYHLARAIGFHKGMSRAPTDRIGEAVGRYLPEAHLAFLHYAIYAGEGDPGQFAQEHMHPESGEFLWEYAADLELDPEAVLPYGMPEVSS